MPHSPAHPATGCLEQRRTGPHQTATIFSLRECHAPHTDPNVVSAHCMKVDNFLELGHDCYPLADGVWHCPQ